ncbi:MAG: LptA/OstA family protein [Endomicrobiia bacterium]
MLKKNRFFSWLLATGFWLLTTGYWLLFCIEPKITSKQIEFRKRENKIIFKENVKIFDDRNILFADYVVKDEKNKIVEMRGNINAYYAVDETGSIKLNTEFGKWDIEKNKAELWGSPFAVYRSSSGDEVEIHSNEVFYDGNFYILKFYGDVLLTYSSNTIRGNHCEYYYKDKMAVFKKDGDIVPVIDYSDIHKANFIADQITFNIPEKKLILEKNVYCKVFPGD